MFFCPQKVEKTTSKSCTLIEVFFLCSPDCTKPPITSFPFYKFFYPIVSAKVSGPRSYRTQNLVLVLQMWENLESNLPEVVFPWRYTSCRLCIAISSWLVTELYSKSCLEASKQESGFPFHLCQVRRKVRKSGGAI